jgi:FlaA1/EpsC-like NDP-sugar epimerase
MLKRTKRVNGLVRRVGHWVAGAIPQRWSGTVQLALDLAGWTLSVLAATYLRLDFSFKSVQALPLLGLLSVGLVAQTVTGFAAGLYKQRWRFGTLDEVSGLIRAAFATTACLTLATAVGNPRVIPLSAAIMGGFVGLVTMFTVRYLWRLTFESVRQPDERVASRTIVFGAGEAGSEIVRSLMRNPTSPYLPVAVLDDDASKQRQEVSHVRVQGTRHDLVAVAQRLNAKTLIIAMPSADTALVTELNRGALELGMSVKILPPVHELFDGRVDIGAIRSLSEVDLLGRREIETDLTSIADYLRNKRVLVTGAGGSIGSELCRQIAKFEPETLFMLDRDESALHNVQMSIEGRALLDSPNLILADIRDGDLIGRLFEQHSPHVVFHAAALKHLPLLESFPGEALKSNVWGTLNVLEAAFESGVEQFVNISTDKAANPGCVLGYSKRIAERLTASIAAKATKGTYLSVRFGNVLGSRGSVLPAFRAMIAAGGPVTVTAPDVTRFFMTIPESVELVIQAGAIGGPGEVLVLDMGDPIRIDHVARMMIRESGRDIAIEYTGLRSGEKLHEELFGDGEVDVRTVHPLISHAPVPAIDVDRVLDLDADADREKVVRALRDLAVVDPDEVVQDWTPPAAPVDPAKCRVPRVHESDRSRALTMGRQRN